MRNLLVPLIVICISTPAFADIRSKDTKEQAFIQITSPSQGSYRLELCGASSAKCSRLGDHDLNESEMKSFARSNYGAMTIKLVGGAAIAAGITYLSGMIFGVAGGGIGEKLLHTDESGTMGSVLIGGLVGLGAGATAGGVILNHLSPIDNYRVGRAFGGGIMDGKDVRVSDVRGLASKIDRHFRSSTENTSASETSAAPGK